MNKTILLALVVFGLLGNQIHATVVLSDDFSGSSINTNLWSVTLPWSDSSVTEGGGVGSIENNGRLTTISPSPADYSVYGSFYLANNPYSNFKVVLRTDGVPDAAEANGVAFQFQIEDDAGNTSENLRIIAGNFSTTAVANLTLNTWNTFLITDDGDNLALYFDGSTNPSLSYSTSYSAGDLITFYNREGAAGGSGISANGITELNNITIQSVPEPSTYALLGLGALALVAVYRRHSLSS
jgi:hypothetical protein